MLSKILKSKWFVSISLLIVAIFMLSLVVLKKQSQVPAKELLVLSDFLEKVLSQKEGLFSLDQNFKRAKLLQKNAFLLPNPNTISAEEKPVDEEQLMKDFWAQNKEKRSDPDWDLFLSMETKYWFDVQQIAPPKFNLETSSEKFQAILLGNLERAADKKDFKIYQKAWLAILEYYYSQLVHEIEPRKRQAFFEQTNLGIMALFPQLKDARRVLALVFLRNINRVQIELEKAKLAHPSEVVLDKDLFALLMDAEFVSKLAVLFPKEKVAQIKFLKTDSWYCSHLLRHRRLLSFVKLGGGEFPLLDEKQLVENQNDFLVRSKQCGFNLESPREEDYLMKMKAQLRLPVPSGKWDLGNKYKSEGIALKKLVVELAQLYKNHQLL